MYRLNNNVIFVFNNYYKLKKLHKLAICGFDINVGLIRLPESLRYFIVQRVCNMQPFKNFNLSYLNNLKVLEFIYAKFLFQFTNKFRKIKPIIVL